MDIKFEYNITEIKEDNDLVTVYNHENGYKFTTDIYYYNYIKKWILNNKNYDNINENLTESQKKNIKNIIDVMKKHKIIYLKREIDTLNDVYVIGTNKCNLRCSHCVMESGNEGITLLTTEKLKEIILDVNIMLPKRLIFTGGEFLLRKDAIEILEFARANYKGKILLCTNSLPINNENVNKIIKYVDQIEISLDGFNEATTSQIRGKGVFEKVIMKIQLLKKCNFTNIVVSSVRIGDNELYEEEFLKLCKSLNVKSVIRRFSPRGRGENEKYKAQVIRLNRVKEINYHNCKKCKPGVREITINADGNVFGCALLMADKYKMGNILNNSLQEIYGNRTKYLDKIISQMNYKLDCIECRHRAYCWPCHAQYEALKNSNLLDKVCYDRKKKFDEILKGGD